MRGALDPSTRDLTNTCVKLVDELVFVPQRHGGGTCYHVEAPSRSQFFRIGYREYVFLSLLDGKTTFAQAVTRAVRVLGADAPTQAQALQIYSWAIENRLTRFVDRPSAAAVAAAPSSNWTQMLARLNPLWIKIPLFRPDRMLQRLLPATGWLFGRAASVISMLLILAAMATIGAHWNPFCQSARQILSRDNWLWLGLVWIGLKLLHEFAHGLVAKRYGGRVNEFGLILAFLAPSAYVDVTPCWRFASKWQRIHLAAAGMFLELTLAALATFAWAWTTSPVARHFLYDVIFMASVSTFLFNANPLMRLDGYYILSDWLEIPNLAQEGQRRLMDRLRWLFFGGRSESPKTLGFRGWLIGVYGFAAAVWRLVIVGSLAVAASALGKGSGVALAAIAVACWFGPALAGAFAVLRQTCRESQAASLRAASVAAALAVLVVSTWCWLPWPGAVAVPGVVDYKDSSIVRSRTAGFVRQLHVRDGQTVAAGDLLLELENQELSHELRSLELDLLQADLRRRAAQERQHPGELQVVERQRQSLDERLQELRRRWDALRVYAPTAGRVVARNLEHRLATYVHEGDELLAIGDESRKELVLSLAQRQWDEVSAQLGGAVAFRVGARSLQKGVLARVEPRATLELPHPALGAESGGPLPVMAVASADGKSQMRLVEPRFRAVVALPEDGSCALACGEQAHAVLGWSGDRFGEHLWVVCTRWLRDQLKSPA